MQHEAFIRTCLVGYVPAARRKAPMWVRIRFDGAKLSITGVIGPLSSGNALGACGQIMGDLKGDQFTPARGWTPHMINDLYHAWNDWHMNDMRPGSPWQRAFIKVHDLRYSDYEYVVNELADNDLLYDTEYWVINGEKTGGPCPVPYGMDVFRAWHDEMTVVDRQKAQLLAVETKLNAVRDDVLKDGVYSEGTVENSIVTAMTTAGFKPNQYSRVIPHSRSGFMSYMCELANMIFHKRLSLKRPRWHDVLYAHMKTTEHLPEADELQMMAQCMPYQFGSAWLFEPVPDHVLQRLRDFPEASTQPAWV